MRLKPEIKLYFMFWLFYIPVSLIIMQFRPVNFTIVMLIGLGIILGYLSLKDAFRKKKPAVKKEAVQVQNVNADAPDFSWTNVFKEDFGRIEYDLN